MIKPKERRHVKVEAPFLNKIFGLGIIKLLALDTYDTLIMRVKFKRNKTFLEIKKWLFLSHGFRSMKVYSDPRY